jgi:hypothetical protein
MTSAINYASINENFPVAGEDNDTQVFRDNFDTIKTSLRSAQEEITALQDTATGAALLGTADNNFNGNVISNAVLQNVSEARFNAGIIGSFDEAKYTVDFENGSYQLIRFVKGTSETPMPIEFQNLPESSANNGKIGRITLELYGDGTTRYLTFVTSAGTEFRRSASTPTVITVSSMTAPVIIEVWRHSGNYIYLNSLGQFS